MSALNPCMCGCGELVRGTFKRGHHGREKHADSDREQIMSDLAKALAKVRPDEPPQIDPPDVATPVNNDPAPVAPPPVLTPHQGPPAYPASIDHRRWLLAGERPNTPKTNPWIETKCHACLNPMWTRDPLSTWEHGGVCEECLFVQIGDYYDRARQQFGVQARTIPNPFRPR